ncbi:YggT family protein [Pelagirhabdus alkalitolerans]|uniref:YggT family protein n=1 Tax=Pelagirhabdus alkalitolerans TaxID=1612202 RepID=A0A1G6H0U9_9BACI|nr:YggT family protein [Pelagirhabdus alkalitolerans]SDB87758.1 YggT family protein [Pelagirhabdus alkalitolerans]
MGSIQSLALTLVELYQFAIVGYILMSWFPGARDSSIGLFLSRIVEPYLEPFRSIIPPLGMIDISGIVALITLRFARNGLIVLFNML